jgi:hypothetical protein
MYRSRWWFPPMDEDVLARWRQHPCRLVVPAAPAVIAGSCWLLFGSRSPVMQDVLGALTVGLTLRFVWYVIGWWADEVVVTKEQIVRVSGVFVRHTTVLLLAHVIGLRCRRSILGRLLGYGELIPESAVHTQAPLHLPFIPRPDERYALINHLLAESAGHPLRQRCLASP